MHGPNFESIKVCQVVLKQYNNIKVTIADNSKTVNYYLLAWLYRSAKYNVIGINSYVIRT